MDSENHDKTFVMTFLGVLGALGAFTFVIIIIANVIGGSEAESPYRMKQVAERIAPVGQVVTDPSMLVKVAEKQAAAHEPMSAEQVVTQVCAACHQAGVLGAPKIGDTADWKARKEEAGGLEGLVKYAINGKGAMPPRGGNPALTDEEIHESVEYMLKKSGL